MDYCDSVRTPVKGLRVRCRTKLKTLGLVGKFSVEHHRRYGLCVHYKEDQKLPELEEFEGFPVRFIFNGEERR